jgi:hypothetical protein
MFSFFIVSVVGLFLCVSPSINGAPPEILQVKIISNLAIGILFASAAFHPSLQALYLFEQSPRPSVDYSLSLRAEPTSVLPRSVFLQTLARAIDAGLHRLRADAEKLRALLLLADSK